MERSLSGRVGESITPMEHYTAMMGKEETVGSVIKAFNELVDMMQRTSLAIMNRMIAKNAPGLSEIIRTMSTQMMYISHLMQRGTVSREEMRMLQQRMHLTEKRIEAIQAKMTFFKEIDV